MISTFLLGWWGIPFGIFRTPIALIQTLIDKNKRVEISDGILTVLRLRILARLNQLGQRN